MGSISRGAGSFRRLSFNVAAVVLLAILSPGAGAIDLTGTWSGTALGLSDCGGTPGVSEGTATLYLVQSGASLTGMASISFSSFGCAGGALTVVASLTGTVSEDGFSATGTAAGLGQAFVGGVIEGEILTFALIAGDTRIAGELTRTSTTPPASELTGFYSGTYTATENVSDRCSNIPSITYAGSIAGNVIQVGRAVSGQLLAHGGKSARPDASRNCTVVDENDPDPVRFSGTITGNTIAGFADDGEGDPAPLTASINGATISGNVGGQRTQSTFTLTRTSTTPAPLILGFGAEPLNIQPGRSAILRWATSNASLVTIDQGIGPRPTTGSITVSPTVTTRYTLTAKGPGGAATAEATVTVVAAPAVVIVSSRPEGMLQRAGEAGATDSYTLTNIGGAATEITLGQTGSFFTQSPQSFSLKAGASQTVTFTALAQPAGVYEGTSTVSGQGVKEGVAIRVILLSAGSPTGTVDPRPEKRRKDISAPLGTDPTGAISFTNRGTGTVEAIAVSNVEWIVPQGGRFTIAPGASASIPFTIRRSLRPDGAAPIGAATGRFGLVFFGAPFSSAGKTAMATVPVSKSLVTVVDVVKPGTTATPPPPLAPGELALFVAGMSSDAGETGDLLIASDAEDTISDLKIYYSATGGAPSFLSGSVSSFVADSGIAFPGLVQNVFGREGQSGTVQLRSTRLNEIAVSATETDTSSETTPVVTALPVFRSDRGADGGEEMILAGVEQGTAATTTVMIQEMAGSTATVQIDAFNAAGAAVGSPRTASVGGFGLLEITDAVPAGAVSLRVRNTSTNASRIAAAAMVTDAGSGDVWAIVDATFNLPLDEPVFVPLLGGLQRVPGAETELVFRNGGTATAAVSVEQHTTRPRKRTSSRAASSSASGSSAAASQNLSIEPNHTVTIASSDGTAGYAVITGGSAVRSVGLMAFAPASGGGRVGSSLPAVPSSEALSFGEAIRFPGVEDAADATAAAGTPVTYSSDLVLVETAGGETGVRVIVRTRAPVSTLVTAEIVAASDITLAPNRFYVIRDVVGTVLGSQRSRYGDLTNVTVDVEVTSGTGRVIPFLQSIDNASHDVVVRTR